MPTSLLLLLACAAEPPAVDAVSPEQGEAGATLQIVGSHLTGATGATLGGQPLSGFKVLGAVGVQGTVPDGLSPGAHDLVLTAADGATVTVTGAFTVLSAEAEDIGAPCAGDFTAYSTITANQETIVIDRRYKGDKEKNHVARIPFKEVERIEYEEVEVDGEVCSAIWIATDDNKRHLFDDDTEIKLRKRAQEIAVGIQKPIEVIAEIKETDKEDGEEEDGEGKGGEGKGGKSKAP